MRADLERGARPDGEVEVVVGASAETFTLRGSARLDDQELAP